MIAALAERLGELDGPEVVILNPLCSAGWMESKIMDAPRQSALKHLRSADRHDHLLHIGSANRATVGAA